MDKKEKKVLSVIAFIIILFISIIIAVSLWCGCGNHTMNTAEITIGEARAVALKDAERTEDAVVFTEQSRTKSYGVYSYEIEFNDGITKYEYNIDAQTGEVISRYSRLIY